MLIMLSKVSGYFSKLALIFLETILLFFILNNIIKISVQAQESIGLYIEKRVDKEHVQRDKPQEGERDVTYAIDIITNGYCNADLDIAIVFDRSGSMINYMDVTKQATISFINEMDESTDLISLVSYNFVASLDQPLTSNFQEVIDSVNILSAYGNTNIGEALLFADQELMDHGRIDSEKVILIFTDGVNNTGYSDEEVYGFADDIKNVNGVRIISVGIGNEIEAIFLETIASSLDDYYWVADTDDLEETFINIARGLQYGNADIQLTDDLSDLLEYTDFIEASDGGYLDGNILKWDFGVDVCLTESRSVNFILKVKEDTPDLTSLINSAVVSDLGSGNQVRSNEVNTIVHAPLVAIEKAMLNEYVLAGDDILYQITLKNLGSGNAYGVEIIDEIPINFLLVYGDSISNSGYFSGGNIIWDNEGRRYILNGYFNPDNSGDALNSGYIFSYKAKVYDEIPSGEVIKNTAVVYSKNRSNAIETRNLVTVSSILAVTGQNVRKVYIFYFSITFIITLVIVVREFIIYLLKYKR